MAYRGKYAGRNAGAGGRDLTYSPTGVQYPQDDRSVRALLKPYGMITASEMGHIGGGIVRRLVGKGRIIELLERQARESHQIGKASVFLLFIDPLDETLYIERKEIDREQVRSWQGNEAVSSLPIPNDTLTFRPQRIRMLPPKLAPLVKLDALRIEAKKTRTIHLSKRLGPNLVVNRRRVS